MLALSKKRAEVPGIVAGATLLSLRNPFIIEGFACRADPTDGRCR
jgi:hypothetical protein